MNHAMNCTFFMPFILLRPQEAIPLQLYAVHYINVPSFMDKMLAMVRPFIKKELMHLIHTHTTLDTFVDLCVPKRMMPTEYGGLAGNIADLIDATYNEIKANGAFYIEEEATKRVNEQLRPAKPKAENDGFPNIFNFFSNGKQKQ